MESSTRRPSENTGTKGSFPRLAPRLVWVARQMRRLVSAALVISLTVLFLASALLLAILVACRGRECGIYVGDKFMWDSLVVFELGVDSPPGAFPVGRIVGIEVNWDHVLLGSINADGPAPGEQHIFLEWIRSAGRNLESKFPASKDLDSSAAWGTHNEEIKLGPRSSLHAFVVRTRPVGLILFGLIGPLCVGTLWGGVQVKRRTREALRGQEALSHDARKSEGSGVDSHGAGRTKGDGSH